MTFSDFKNWHMEIENLFDRDFLNNYPKISIKQMTIHGFSSEFEELISYGEVPILTIEKYTQLVRTIGLLKSYFSDRHMRVFLRGQTQSHGYLQLPSIFRFTETENSGNKILTREVKETSKFSPWKMIMDALDKTTIFDPIVEKQDFPTRLKKLDGSLEILFKTMRFQTSPNLFKSLSDSQLKKIKPKEFKFQNMLAWEPILQHYGYKTRWLDLVDNIPIALRFASQNIAEQSNHNVVSKEDTKQYGFLFVYGVLTEKQIAKGVWDSSIQRLVNLAEATNPYVLRPHMQYAYSLFNKEIVTITQEADFQLDPWHFLGGVDYSKFLLCVIRIRKRDIFNWITIENDQKVREFPEHLTRTSLVPSPNEDNFFAAVLFAEAMARRFNKSKEFVPQVNRYGYKFPDEIERIYEKI